MPVRRARRSLAVAALAATAFAATSLPALAAPSTNGASAGSPTGLEHSNRPVCPTAGPSEVHCHARVVTDAGGVKPLASTTYTSGYGPADLQSAYALAGLKSGGRTIAIVDAYDNPNAESDLNAYRAQFGIPLVNHPGGPNFKKVDQRGGTSYPRGDTGWGQEIALDLDMASAICPDCNILLVEADSNSFTNLFAAVDYAATQNVAAISNSYGGSEFSGEASYESHYNHSGITVTVSSGDNGYGVEFPAASRFVTAVGGTSLKRAANTRGWSETAWSGAGSGCSAYIQKPSFQKDTGCSRRTVADVSAVADPNTGVAVYDSYGSTGGANWMVFGGTSVAAPVIAGVYALKGTGLSNATPYGATSSLFDVTSGSNGRCTTGGGRKGSGGGAAYLCTAGPGYDGPTGLGTPNGTGAF